MASESEVQPTVTVIGVAVVRTEPDEAIVSITVSALDALPGPALGDVARRTDALAEILDGLEIAGRDRSTTGLTVREEFEHTKDGRRSLGHRASASVSVRLADTATISRLIMRASEELDARIEGPVWRISAANPASLDAATKAAANAKSRAAAYAAGVGARLGALIALSEPEPRHGLIQPAAARVAAGPDVHVDSGEQEVAAIITATFALHLT